MCALQFPGTLSVADVRKAFLNAPFPKDSPLVLLRPPVQGMQPQSKEGPGFWLLRKAVYGLCDAGRLWNGTLHSRFVRLGWSRSTVDPCLYVKKEAGKIVNLLVVHVDDIPTAHMLPRLDPMSTHPNHGRCNHWLAWQRL